MTQRKCRSYSALALLLTAIFCSPVDAHPEIQIQVHSHIESTAEPKNAPSDETFLLAVTLGQTYLITESKGTRTIYDFERKRILVLDLKTKTYADYSLYSNIGYRVLEFYNRQMIRNALQAAKIESPLPPPALVEQLFSLTDDKENTVIETATITGHRVFSWQDNPLVTVTDSVAPLPDAYRSEYWRFIRYYAGGHPQILSALGAEPGIPTETTFVLTNLKTETRTLTVQRISSPPDANYSLAGYTLKMPDAEPFKTLAKVGANSQDQVNIRVEAANKDRDIAFSQGRYLDAALANFEAFLSTGEADSAWLSMAREALTKDPKTQLLLGSISPRDKNGAPRAVNDLAELRALNPARVDVLDVFEGNTRIGLNQGPQGVELLLAALRQNPYFTGAWHDLGDYYYRSFRMQEAWACLDAARAMRPNDPMLREMDQLEQQLRARNPAFF
jgi:hypothetical protein